MNIKPNKVGCLTEALLKAAGDLHEIGIMTDADHDRITMRHLGKEAPRTTPPFDRC